MVEPLPAKTKLEEMTPHEDCTKIAIIGNVDSGKSTLVGVLTKGIPDDGRGSARQRVFNYPHEDKNGRTSSIAYEIMGFDHEGNQKFPERFNPNKNKYWREVVNISTRTVSLLDLCGHEKYLKTTMFGMVGLAPDYSLIVIGSNMGISKMTMEHLQIALSLKVPFFVVMTKIDMSPPEKLKETQDELIKKIKTPNLSRIPVLIKETATNEEIENYAKDLYANKIVPIFHVSSVVGTGLDKLSKFIYYLSPRTALNPVYKGIDMPPEFDIHDNFVVSGTGLVVSGLLKAGIVKVNHILMFGPDNLHQFRPVVIKSIHINKVDVKEACTGQLCCFAIKSKDTKKGEIKKEDFRKGMVMVDPILKPMSTWKFEAKINVLHHPTMVQVGQYQGMLHCGVVRQAVKIEKAEKEILRSGDRGINAVFTFLYHPEYIKNDAILLIREGLTKITGIVTKVLPVQEQPLPTKPEKVEKVEKAVKNET